MNRVEIVSADVGWARGPACDLIYLAAEEWATATGWRVGVVGRLSQARRGRDRA